MRLLVCRGVVDVGAPPGDVNDGGAEFVGEVIGHECASITGRRICSVADAVGRAEFVVAEIDLTVDRGVDHRLLRELRYLSWERIGERLRDECEASRGECKRHEQTNAIGIHETVLLIEELGC